jgi:type I restriction enzyme S subunit
MTSRVTKGASPKWQGFQYQDEGIMFVRSQNVGWGELRLSDRAYLPAEFNKKQRNSVVSENDVLLNIVGASIGRSAVASTELVGANCNQAVAIIRLSNPNYIDARYLSLWLQSDEAQETISLGSVDVARANFSLASIRSLRLPWPDKEKRRQVVRSIETAFNWINRLIVDAVSARTLIDRLDQAVLEKAFRGELVPQDPSDEPASTLLKRIRAERAPPSVRSRAVSSL